MVLWLLGFEKGETKPESSLKSLFASSRLSLTHSLTKSDPTQPSIPRMQPDVMVSPTVTEVPPKGLGIRHYGPR
ncbi:hypothetical protein C1H46_024595 [Malus baccata]|uniref:Uncharacterized protein n=1 Tax=Malus baccata TaxID=106549 RepID=A0A540LU41_MALBA|nr:hypothetical protein C1H46_024595 [Malus baccata]